MALDPIYGAGLQAIGNTLAGAYSGQDPTGKTSVVSPMQRLLLYTLQRNAMLGNLGDFGGGTAFRQGQANFAQSMADRGIDPSSGVYASGLANIAQQAQSQDTNALRQYILSLAGTPVQTVNTSGWTNASGGIPTNMGGTTAAPPAATSTQPSNPYLDVWKRRRTANG